MWMQDPGKINHFHPLDLESGMNKFGSGIRDKYPRSATLPDPVLIKLDSNGACSFASL
jgi:hypothetical protein